MKSEVRKCGKCGQPALALRRVYFGTSTTTKDYACSSCGEKASVGTWGSVAMLAAIPLVAYPLMYHFNGPPPMGAYFAAVAVLGWAGWVARGVVKFDKAHPSH